MTDYRRSDRQGMQGSEDIERYRRSAYVSRQSSQHEGTGRRSQSPYAREDRQHQQHADTRYAQERRRNASPAVHEQASRSRQNNAQMYERNRGRRQQSSSQYLERQRQHRPSPSR